MGGTIGRHAGNLFNLDDRDLRTATMAGMAAFFSALFGTPLTATVFAIVVISIGVVYHVAFIPCLTASLVAYWISVELGVAPTRFSVAAPELEKLMLLRVAVLGVGCALVSVLLCRTLHFAEHQMKKRLLNAWLRVLVGGGAVIALTYLCGTRDYNGAGMDLITAAVEQGTALDAPYVENFSHTEYQSEATVYAYLKQVSDFLKRYQELDAEYALLPPEPYDPQNYLLQWRLHMRELINELFNMFVGGNLFSTAAMTRTLMECCVYGKVLKQEKSARLLEDWFLCGMIRSLPGQDGALRQAKLKTVYALCSAWNREPEETIRRFKKGNENEWLVSVIPGKGRIYFSHVCEYLQETELYQTYQWACAFVHGQDIRSKMHPFTFYDSTYHLLTVMMSYIFRAIRLYPVSEELEAEMQKLERDLAALWGTTSWDKNA